MKIVIFLTASHRQRMVEANNPFELTLEDFNAWQPEALEEYGRTWARFWKDDIVMLVEEDE